jgi:hypothetical protein
MYNELNHLHPKTPESEAHLDSWKAIASHFDRDVRTVQRWARHEGLPVRRHFHRKGCTVYALKCEVDSWLTTQSQTLSERGPLQGPLKYSANPSPQVTRQMVSAFCLWLAIMTQESFRDSDALAVQRPD